MISESYYWKYELYKCFLTIAKFIHSKRKAYPSYVKIEKALMIGAFIIRKLTESLNLPPDFLKEKIVVKKYKCKVDFIDFLNRHEIDLNYDFDKIRQEDKEWQYLINQIIHSYSFLWVSDNKLLEGFFINSDKSKNDSIYLICIKDILTIFLKVSEGSMGWESFHRDQYIDKNSELQPGPIELKYATYVYPDKSEYVNIVVGFFDIIYATSNRTGFNTSASDA